ncbi:MAG TPA: oligopeptide/dipeptide ABC transporter ATP-binding protein [Usitatibacter sp.]|nr:oligopeptide/dipeptide ABC transporter ATP-binding protein [Usitatibacter sp.]
MSMAAAPILEVRGVVKRFPVSRGMFGGKATVHAVEDVSFDVAKGESLGLVGESGCGKSTLARCVLRLVEPQAGQVVFEGEDILALERPDLRRVRRRMQIVFQDPYASLNPRRTVLQTLAEPLAVHGMATKAEAGGRIAAALQEVGLPADAAGRYPHEFSGGQRQRIGIARALVIEPQFIVADEPVSALDVSVQAQVLALLEALRAKRGLSFLFVSHDLGVVRHVCDRVAVMYLGRIVEEAPVPDIFDRPLHPYTRVLRAASPVPDPAARFTLPRVEGEIPSAMDPPPGCAFSPRCPHAMPRCTRERPALVEVAPRTKVACFLHSDAVARIVPAPRTI